MSVSRKRTPVRELIVCMAFAVLATAGTSAAAAGGEGEGADPAPRYLEPGNGRALYFGLGWRHE